MSNNNGGFFEKAETYIIFVLTAIAYSLITVPVLGIICLIILFLCRFSAKSVISVLVFLFFFSIFHYYAIAGGTLN